MIHKLHFTHHGNKTMMKQARSKVFWPGMHGDLREKYENCEECREHKPSKAQAHNENYQKNMFDTYLPLPSQRQSELPKHGMYPHWFYQSLKTANQSKNEAIWCVREWAAFYGMPYAIKADSGPSFG